MPRRSQLPRRALYDGPVVALAEFSALEHRAVRIDPGDDARALLPTSRAAADRGVVPQIPRRARLFICADSARGGVYRRTARVGDVLIDQIVFLRRVGFDSFAPRAAARPGAVDVALARFPFVYQPAADTPSYCPADG